MNLNDILKQVSSRSSIAYYDNQAYVEEWYEWYQGYVQKFHSYSVFNGRRKVNMKRMSLAMAKRVCEDWANLLINEHTDITLSNEEAQAAVEQIFEDCHFWRKANDGVEKTFALGSGAFVVTVNDIEINDAGDIISNDKARVKVSFVNAKKIRPITFEDGDITECAFITVGDKKTTIAVHLLDDDGNYQIHNIVCEGTDEDNLTYSPDNYYVFDTKSPTPWFYVFRPNVANNIELNSPLGVSVFANAIHVLESIDLFFDSYVNEITLGRMRIFVNAKQTTYNVKTGEEIEVFDSNDVVFYTLPEADNDDGVFIKNETPTLRITDHQTGLQSQLNLLSQACGFGTNRYKFDGGSIATATQIVSENSDLFRNLKKHEIIIEEALKTVVKAVIYASNTFTNTYIDPAVNIEIKFDDSIIEDKASEQANDRMDVSMGVMSKAEFRAKWYNEDLETAQRKIDEMSSFTIADNEPYTDEEVAGGANVNPDVLPNGEVDVTDKEVANVTENAEKVVKQPLLVGQIQAMAEIVAGYKDGKYSFEQAKNMLIIGIGLTEQEANSLLGMKI